MALKADGAPLSLRPMSLRPGGGNSKNPFERFAKGAGANTQKAKAYHSRPSSHSRPLILPEISAWLSKTLQHDCWQPSRSTLSSGPWCYKAAFWKTCAGCRDNLKVYHDLIVCMIKVVKVLMCFLVLCGK